MQPSSLPERLERVETNHSLRMGHPQEAVNEEPLLLCEDREQHITA